VNSRVVVVDNFYSDPDAVRRFALENMNFNSAGRYNYPGWQSEKALHSDQLKERFEEVLGVRIDVDPSRFTWGGFRVITKETGSRTKVHADSVVDWAGMVYLTPDAPMSVGTGFFRHKATGLESPPSDREARELGYSDAEEFDEKVVRRDMADLNKWELTGYVGPVYNRLVIFRGCELFHAPLGGVGDSAGNARLTHNFFFDEAVAAESTGRLLGSVK